MDTPEERHNWGDPYIGLHLAADAVRGFTAIALDTPRWPLAGMYSTLGSPTIWDDLRNIWDKILFWINPFNFLPQLWNQTVYPAILWLKDHLFEPFKGIFDAVIEPVKVAFEAVRDWLKDTFGEWVASIKDSVVNAYIWLSQTFSAGWTTIKDAVVGAWEWLRGTFVYFVSGIEQTLLQCYMYLVFTFQHTVLDIRTALVGAWVWLRDTFAYWVGAIEQTLLQCYMYLVFTFQHTVLDIRTALVGAWEWLRDTALPFLRDFPTTIWTSLQTWWNNVISGFAAWWADFKAQLRRDVEEAIRTVSPVVRGWVEGFQSLPGTYLEWVAETAGTDLALEPSRALATTGSLYMMALGAGTGAHVLSTALNIIPTMNWVGASQLSAYVAQAAAFEPLTNATYGVLVNEALAWPLRYHWNQRLRPRMPTEGEIFLMGRKRGLTRGEFAAAMAYQGLPNWWIDKEYTFFWTDPSPYWLLRMSEQANPQIEPSSAFLPWLQDWLPNWRNDPWAWYKMKLMLAGFEDTDIPAFISGFQRRMVATAITQVKTSIRAMLREAYWDRDQAQDALRPLGVRQEEVEYLILAEEIDYQNRYLDGEVASLTESYRKGEISRQDFSLALSTIIVKPERVAQIVAREDTRKLPKPKSIVPAKENPRVKSLVTQAVGSWTRAYRDWKITEGDLELGLTLVLQDAALAEQMVLVERTRYRPLPPIPKPPPEDPVVAASRRAAISTWLSQYREGVITAAVMEIGLRPLIDDPERLRQIRELEQLRAEPPPEITRPVEEDPLVRSLVTQAVGSWTRAYRDWRITEQDLELGLTVVLRDPPLVREMMEVERARYRPPLPPEPPPPEDPLVAASRRAAIASWVKQFRDGLITADVMEVGLSPLIDDPERLGQIRELEVLRATPVPDIIPPWEEDPQLAALREETVRGHIEMFRKRIIDIEELYTYLVADGLAEPLARSTALTQALKRVKTPPLESPYFQQDRLRELIDEAVDSYTRMFELGEISLPQFEAYLAGTGVDPALITYLGDTLEVRQFVKTGGLGW